MHVPVGFLFFLSLFSLSTNSLALNVRYLDGKDSFDAALDVNTFLHVQFPASCDRNCRGTFSFAAPAGPVELRLMRDSRQEGVKLTVAVENANNIPEQGSLVDRTTLQGYALSNKVTDDKTTDRVIVVNVLATSLEARFAILTAPSLSYEFSQVSIGFPLVVGSRRQWSRTFYFPYIYGALVLFYFLAWPLRKRRPHTQTMLTSVAAMSILAWLIDAFYHYFLLLELSEEQSAYSFFLHVFGNVVYLFLLLAVHNTSRRWTILFVGIFSLLNGGAGFYACPVLLFLELYFLEQGARKKQSSLVCKQS